MIELFLAEFYTPLVLTQKPRFLLNPYSNTIFYGDIRLYHHRIRQNHGKIMSLILFGTFDKMTQRLLDDKVIELSYCPPFLSYNGRGFNWRTDYEHKLILELIELSRNKNIEITDRTIQESIPEIRPQCHKKVQEIQDQIIDTIIPNFSFNNIKMSKKDHVRNTRKLVHVKHYDDIKYRGIAVCPNCKNDIHGKWKNDKCFNCGQKIKWKME